LGEANSDPKMVTASFGNIVLLVQPCVVAAVALWLDGRAGPTPTAAGVAWPPETPPFSAVLCDDAESASIFINECGPRKVYAATEDSDVVDVTTDRVVGRAVAVGAPDRRTRAAIDAVVRAGSYEVVLLDGPADAPLAGFAASRAAHCRGISGVHVCVAVCVAREAEATACVEAAAQAGAEDLLVLLAPRRLLFPLGRSSMLRL